MNTMENTFIIKKLLIVSFAVAIVGFGGWQAYNSDFFGTQEDNPPLLKLGGTAFEGKFVDTTYNFLQFDDSDRLNFIGSAGSQFVKGAKGLHYYYPKVDITFDALVKSVRPVDALVDGVQFDPSLKVLFVRYDATEPWAGDSAVAGCFKTYPAGLYDNTCEVAEEKLMQERIDMGSGFVIIANEPFEYDSNIIADAKTLSISYELDNINGWVMYPLSSSMDFTNSRIKVLWVQKADNEFEKVTNISNINPEAREYKMAWFKLGDAVVEDIYQSRT